MGEHPRGPGSQFHKDQTSMGKALAQPSGNMRHLPYPMPARLSDGTLVWLHYEPLRWERHP